MTSLPPARLTPQQYFQHFPGEAAYLWLFDDVRTAVEEGRLPSGEAHFQHFGAREIATGQRLLAARKWYSLAYLRGLGVEIGALHNPLPVPPEQARVLYVDRLERSHLREQYPDLDARSLAPLDFIGDGERLACVRPASLDFIIANHVIEHMEDPIGALNGWFAALKPGGILYLAVPDKRATFDAQRVVTPWSHLVADHEMGSHWTRAQHFEEWARYVSKVAEAEVGPLTHRLMDMNYSIHFHVWDPDAFAAFLDLYAQSYNPGFQGVDYFEQAGDMEFIHLLKKSDAAP